MKYRIEYRSSRIEGRTESSNGYVIQNLGGHFHEFDADNDADAQAKAPAEWQKVFAVAREFGLRTIGFVRLERVPDPTPIVLAWTPAAA